jgi:hypothetical protein
MVRKAFQGRIFLRACFRFCPGTAYIVRAIPQPLCAHTVYRTHVRAAPIRPPRGPGQTHSHVLSPSGLPRAAWEASLFTFSFQCRMPPHIACDRHSPPHSAQPCSQVVRHMRFVLSLGHLYHRLHDDRRITTTDSLPLLSSSPPAATVPTSPLQLHLLSCVASCKRCARTCAHTYLHIKCDSKGVRNPPLVSLL